MRTVSSVTQALRDHIHARDGGVCQYCGNPPRRYSKLILEHIVPVSLGGPKIAPRNLVSACTSCNSLKCNRVWIPRNLNKIAEGLDEWRQFILSNADVPGQVFALHYGRRKTKTGLVAAVSQDEDFVHCPQRTRLQVHMRLGKPLRVWRLLHETNAAGQPRGRQVWAPGKPMTPRIARAVEIATAAMTEHQRQREALRARWEYLLPFVISL